MRYLCLAYYDEAKFGAVPKDELDALVARCRLHDEELRESGQLQLVASLGPPGAAAVLRPRGGETTVTDGPYAETKEQVGAFFLIEARDLNDAIRVASKHPAARLGEDVGWGIEVRAVEFFDQPAQA